MSERKNIERLFQEKFKDFEVAPAPQAWENIASKLEKKENKRRVIPFWFKASGIAASLVLGYFAIDTYTNGGHPNSTENNAEKVVSSESSEKELLQKENLQNTSVKELQKNSSIVPTNNAISTKPNQNNVVVVNEDNNVSNQNSKSNQSNSNYSVVENKKAKSNRVVQSFQSNITNQVAVHTNKHKKSNSTKSLLSEDEKVAGISPSYNETQSQSVVQNNQTVNQKASLKNGNLSKESTSFDNSNEETQSQSVAQNNQTVNQKASLKNGNLSKESTSFDNSNEETQSQSVAQNNQTVNQKASLKGDNLSKENTSFDNSNKETQSVAQNTNASDAKSVVNLTENTNPIENSSDNINQKSSIASATNQSVNPLAVIAKDSVAVAAEENPLEKILKEKELQKKEEKVLVESTPKWKIKPNVAPLYMNSPEGSPIDAQFADNSKKFENKMSIGLGVDYALSSKVSLRTGINQFDLGYNTNDIAFYADLNSKGLSGHNAITTIDLRPDAQSIVIEDRKNASSQELAIQNKETGYLSQRMGYVEVPVEVSYKLLDKKFGIQFITGVSTLFLNDNQVSVVSSGLTTVLGEANNLNKVHFSTNIGLGFKYSFWKSFEANFEPTFKYQINTFNDNSGGFKPYLIGLYSGLSFKF
ncbi:MAG: hypothetical protein ABI426_11195 [Flavobacterium sp.]